MDAKKRTITLTDRRPVSIVEADWPIIARGSESHSTRNGTPLPDYESSEWRLFVRRHQDGRAIVYGVVDGPTTGWPGAGIDWRGGELLDAGADLALAVRRVGEAGAIPGAAIRECIADLPAEEI